MYMDAGYQVADDAPIPPGALTVLSAGHYRLLTATRFRTARMNGRPDFQLLYIAAGRARFWLEHRWVWVAAGQLVLYRPGEQQEYTYYLADRPEVYWVHFAGDEAAALLEAWGQTAPLTAVGTSPEYARLFGELICELQHDRLYAGEMSALLLRQLVVAFSRGRQGAETARRSPLVEQAVADFHAGYASPLCLSAYARERGVELCWFSRLFRRQMGMSPQQYLIQLRLSRAKELLCSTDCPVEEVARLVGYDNPLYFSRLFSRRVGMPPREYRKSCVDFSGILR
ncbi:MAG: AraC family transcriptional regulator [Clostridia bacterium]|nr:AraC family transcriptional regulator [Clostridia bacterium]